MFEGHCTCALLFLYIYIPIYIPLSTLPLLHTALFINFDTFSQLNHTLSVHVKYLNDEVTSYPNLVRN